MCMGICIIDSCMYIRLYTYVGAVGLCSVVAKFL